jgi:DNA-binding Lrp family transcriptional regulator
MHKLDGSTSKSSMSCKKHGRITNVNLSEAVGLSPSPCQMRVKRVEQAGLIKGYSAQIELAKLGDTLMVFTEVTLADHRRTDFGRFEDAKGASTRSSSVTW